MTYPTTLDGRELDSYCNTIDGELHELLEPIRALDPAVIPSQDQREAFLMMRTLLEWAESFTGTLRYDVSVKHDDCPEHDEYARRKIARVKEVIAGL